MALDEVRPLVDSGEWRPGRDCAKGKGRILVVDDEPAIRDILVTSLSMEGHSCVSAEDGRVALGLLSGGLV